MADYTYRTQRPAERMGAFPWLKKASWGAIFAGTFLAMVSQLTLSVLGAAIGLSVSDFSRESLQNLGMSTIVWWILSAIISMFIGGWIAGRLANTASRLDNALHGLVAWSLAVVISLAMLGSALGSLGGMAISTGLPQQAAAKVGDQTATTQPTDEQKQKAEQGARIAGKAAWGAFAMLILGAAAAFFGGMITLVDYPPRSLEEVERTEYPPTTAPPETRQDLPRTPPPTV